MRQVIALLCVTILAICLSTDPKIHPHLLRDLSLNGGRADALIHMRGTVNLNSLTFKGEPIENLKDYDLKAKIIVQNLMRRAQLSQAQLIRFLENNGIEYTVIWITNSIYVKNIGLDLVEEIAKRSDVEQIVANEMENLDIPKPIKTPHPEVIDEIQYHVEWVKAPLLWKEGYTGKGIIVSNGDTGVHFTHEALVDNYRGNIGGKFDHHYNWFDPSNRKNTSVPKDTDGHGTHTMGINCGNKKGIGIAPGAKWIACKSLSSSDGVLVCLQWLLAPTNLEGKNPRPELRPHTTSHSYYCVNCRVEEAVDALVAAGIAFVKSAGNQGPRCNSITEPGFYKNAIAVAALDEKSDKPAYFSSRGPYKDLIKPDYATPGSNVYSSVNGDTKYAKMSGTSMAAPNLSGAIALLWSAVPELVRDVKTTREILAKSALHQEFNGECESKGSPNNVVGHGTINIYKAYEIAKKMFNK